MADCERLPTCSYFHNLATKMPATVGLFKKAYCQNDLNICACQMLHSFLEKKGSQVSEELGMKIEKISHTLAPNDHEKVLALISS